MNNMIKKAGLIFIGIASLVILGHAVLPHYHHFDFVYSHFDSENTRTSPRTNHSEDNQQACHAFNDLVINKIIIDFDKTIEITPYHLFQSFVIITPFLRIPGTTSSESILFKLTFIASYPFRGPPANILF